jgi:divalent metal cation (Fe/Co/Zn/Cd) transporter
MLDTNLPKTEENLIQGILLNYAEEYLEYHDLRTRKAGSDRYIDLHLVVPKYKDIEDVHNLCDRIEDDNRMQLPGVQILIHTEPCDAHCEDITGVIK